MKPIRKKCNETLGHKIFRNVSTHFQNNIVCIRLLFSIIRNNFETNIAMPLKVIKSYKHL